MVALRLKLACKNIHEKSGNSADQIYKQVKESICVYRPVDKRMRPFGTWALVELSVSAVSVS